MRFISRPRLNTLFCEHGTEWDSVCFGKETRSDFKAEVRLDETWVLFWAF